MQIAKWIDYGNVRYPKTYESMEEVLDLIRSLLKDDEDVLMGRNVKDILSQELLSIGDQWYGIYVEYYDANLEFHDSGDGIEYELWRDVSNDNIYKVPIEVVRDFRCAELTTKKA